MSIIVTTQQPAESIVASDLIRRSMYLISAVAAGETPDDADLNDALITFQEMLGSLNLQSLVCYAGPNENLTLIPGQATYDWGLLAGPLGFTSKRPIQINGVTCVRDGVSTVVDVVTQDQYDMISLKTNSQAIVEQVLYVNSYPLGQLTCYPVPSEAVTLNVGVNYPLNGPLTLQSILALPPGYQRMLRYNLAVDLWPEYANITTDIASIKEIAKKSLGIIKVANSNITPSTFESIPSAGLGRGWDWREG